MHSSVCNTTPHSCFCTRLYIYASLIYTHTHTQQREQASVVPTADTFPKSIKDVYILSDRTRKRNKDKRQGKQSEGGEGDGEEYVAVCVRVRVSVCLSVCLLGCVS